MPVISHITDNGRSIRDHPKFKGMTTSDIETHIQEIYGVEVSDTTVSRITDKILPIAKEWQ